MNHENDQTCPPQSWEEELANSLSHGAGLLIGIIAVPLLLAAAYKAGTTAGFVGAAVFGFSFLLVYATSTLYHSVSGPRAKHLCRIADHIAIYFLIAGSYTPFVLVYLFNPVGITILAILWTLTLVGIFFKIRYTGRFEGLSLGIYLLMGWMLVFAARSFYLALPTTCLWLIAAGGLLYSAGVIFYRWDSLRYNHAIWHGFVLAASLFHFAAVWWAVG